MNEIFQRYQDIFGGKFQTECNVDIFRSVLRELRHDIEADSEISNLFAGVHVPFILPKKEILEIEGDSVEILIQKVGVSFQNMFPDYSFRNLLGFDIKSVLGTDPESRWNKLEAAWQKSTLVGWYFPTALAGFAIPDQVKTLGRLPEALILSGVLEVSAALIGTPNLLMKSDGKYPNLLALTANTPTLPETKHLFWFFEAYGWNLNFNWRSKIGAVSEYYSGGLTIVKPIS